MQRVRAYSGSTQPSMRPDEMGAPTGSPGHKEGPVAEGSQFMKPNLNGQATPTGANVACCGASCPGTGVLPRDAVHPDTPGQAGIAAGTAKQDIGVAQC